MMLIVQKYGGTSLEDTRCIFRAAGRIAKLAQQGHRLVVVVSAQGQTTDEMIGKAELISMAPPAREMDAYLASGEQMSAALLAMAVEQTGHPAVSLTGYQAGIRTDSNFSNARILRISPGRIQQELDEGNVVIVAGFQGADSRDNITTLGRGGSDTTAVALAAALKADICQIFTDVDGVYDRDPRKDPEAVRFDRISYPDMMTLIRQGAQVLHDRSVEWAQAQNVTLEVRSAFTEATGTIVGDLE